jgi:hypothetical protein
MKLKIKVRAMKKKDKVPIFREFQHYIEITPLANFDIYFLQLPEK